MPMPSPRKGEKESDFVGRCIKAEKKASPERPDKQIQAMCYTRWRKAKGIKEPKKKEKNKGADMKSELFRGDIARGLE